MKGQMAEQAAEAEQARLELAEERSRIAHLLQEMEELRPNASVELKRRLHADDRVEPAEAERQGMANRLARMEEERGLLSEQMSKALADRAAAEEDLKDEQKKTSQLSSELTLLQKQ